MKISELDSSIADILQNYNHPLFEQAFQMIDDNEFTEEEEDDKQYVFEFTDK